MHWEAGGAAAAAHKASAAVAVVVAAAAAKQPAMRWPHKGWTRNTTRDHRAPSVNDVNRELAGGDRR